MSGSFADLSHHQDPVDLAAYQRAGHDRVCLKATGGATDGTLRYVDPAFAARWRLAGQLGLHRIAYHYARNNNGGGDELGWCLDRIDAAGGLAAGDVLCYDQEDTRPGGAGLARQRTAEFTAAAVHAGITSGWIYSGKWYLDPAGLRVAAGFRASALPASDLPAGWRQLWISDYTTGQPDAAVELPAGWARAQIVARQYTNKATVPGIAGPCDYSRVLVEWIGGDQPMSAAELATLTAAIADLKTAVTDGFSTLYNLTRAQDKTGKPDPGHAEQAVTTANSRLTSVGGAVAKIGVQVGALGDDEAKILSAVAAGAGADAAQFAALLAAGSQTEAKLIAVIEATPPAPGGGVDGAALVAALRDTLIAGTASKA